MNQKTLSAESKAFGFNFGRQLVSQMRLHRGSIGDEKVFVEEAVVQWIENSIPEENRVEFLNSLYKHLYSRVVKHEPKD